MEQMPRPKVYYECDPDKNVNCPKTNCKYKAPPAMPGPCHETTHPEFAKDTSHARLIVPVDPKDLEGIDNGDY